MERFKACEKEIKTKAFSKEGLIAATKLDPKEQIKQECSNSLGQFVDELSRQIETSEAELEQLQGSSSKRNKKSNATQERVSEIENKNERRNWHISRLELTMRLLENDQLTVDQINNIKDDIQYFVESNNEEEFEEDEGIYDELNLDEEEQMYGMGISNNHNNDEQNSSHDSISVSDEPAVTQPSKQSKSNDDEQQQQDQQQSEQHQQQPSSSKKSSKKPSITSLQTESNSNTGAIPPPNFNQQPVKPNVSSPTISQSKPVPAPPTIKYATAAANAVTNNQSSNQINQSNNVTDNVSDQQSTEVEQPQQQLPLSPGQQQQQLQQQLQQDQQQLAALSPQYNTNPPSTSTTTSKQSGLPNVLTDLATSFESAKQRSSSLNVNNLHQVLDSSLSNLPEPIDGDKPKYYVPKSYWPSPSYYPQSPKKELEHPSLFSRLETDTLFYIFYYMQGTYQQYLAAKELKKQSWRFHKQYLTWFQRHSEPNTITDDYEQGAYIYFDWEGTWCERKKNDFKFDYIYLEDNLQ